MSTLRIATLNVWNKSGPWSERLPLIQRELRRLEPSIVGLQEVLRFAPNGLEDFVPDPETCQASEIAAGFEYRVAYAAATDYAQGLKFGNAVLSRFPILDQATFALPGREIGESRALLYTLLDTEFGRLPVFVTHLAWRLHHGSLRLSQTRAVVEHVFRLAPIKGDLLPPVLMGDFNADPDSDEMRYLRGLAAVDGRTVYFADAWLYGGDGSFGATFDRRNDHARVAHEPPRRIDYIYVRGPDSLLRGEPIKTQVAFDAPGPNATIWPSDHFGVVSDVVFAARSP